MARTGPPRRSKRSVAPATDTSSTTPNASEFPETNKGLKNSKCQEVLGLEGHVKQWNQHVNSKISEQGHVYLADASKQQYDELVKHALAFHACDSVRPLYKKSEDLQRAWPHLLNYRYKMFGTRKTKTEEAEEQARAARKRKRAKDADLDSDDDNTTEDVLETRNDRPRTLAPPVEEKAIEVYIVDPTIYADPAAPGAEAVPATAPRNYAPDVGQPGVIQEY